MLHSIYKILFKSIPHPQLLAMQQNTFTEEQLIMNTTAVKKNFAGFN